MLRVRPVVLLEQAAQRGSRLEPEAAREVLSWEHSGFSVHAQTIAPRGDREALERLLYYCARPALSVRRLTYRKEEGLAVYEARSKELGTRRLVFDAVEFIGRLARLIPPPAQERRPLLWGAGAQFSPGW